MSTSPEQIDLWRSIPKETPRLEFKEAKTQFDYNKLLRYCVAIANEGGGHLVLGISDKVPRAVVGTAAFADLSQVSSQIFHALGFRVEAEEIRHADGRVVAFHIPSRPRGTAYQHEGAYLMRSGEQLVSMSEDQLRKIFAEGAPDWLEEPAVQGLDGQRVIELLDTQTFFELLQLPYPSSRDGVLDRLKSERLIFEEKGTYSIRRLGAVLLAKDFVEFPELARKAPRVVVYTKDSKLETRLDQTGRKGYAVGFQGLVKFIVDQLPQDEVIKDALRVEVKLVPDVVVRELVANALIHQDFLFVGGSVMVEVYSNRIEFSNPGEPIVPTSRFIDGYQSRNERLADLMRRMHICEEKGSGIDRVVKAAEDYQLPGPEFIVLYRRTAVIIHGQRPFTEMDREDRIRACYQHCVLRYMRSQRMTNQSLRERFRLEESKSAVVSQIIATAIEAKLVKPDNSAGGSKKYARYLPGWT